ncbi:MAG: tRNA dihydrouridine(20/20a) synthase DusA [Alphaproteobacteria bacterium]
MTSLDRRFCVAPMMDGTDRHQRFMARALSRHAFLYSEMINALAIVHGDRDRLLGYSEAEHPVALQLGGSDPTAMAEASTVAEGYGYDEVNINVGCPSDRVQDGRFGACLMAEPETVAACVTAMRAAVSIPVTVKSRIGIDDNDAYEDLVRFVEPVAAAGCRVFIVHARKAILSGLSPKQNREIPPLHYDRVYRLKADCPDLEIILNGGLADLATAHASLARVDGVMLGRAAYHNPYLMADVDALFHGDNRSRPSRANIARTMIDYAEGQLAAGWRLTAITRHMMGLYQGQPGARAWRRHLATAAPKPGAGPHVIADALALVEAARAAA